MVKEGDIYVVVVRYWNCWCYGFVVKFCNKAVEGRMVG